jgi:small subunit ribosomal protein S8
MITDPIADALTRIRNALSSRHRKVNIKHSKFVENIIRVFFRIGYINGLKVYRQGISKYITIILKYDNNDISIIHGLKRVSKPSLRMYCNSSNIPVVYNGMGTSIISTSKGIKTSCKAKKQNIGGEIICFIW